jgi:hypothetical protein
MTCCIINIAEGQCSNQIEVKGRREDEDGLPLFAIGAFGSVHFSTTKYGGRYRIIVSPPLRGLNYTAVSAGVGHLLLSAQK